MDRVPLTEDFTEEAAQKRMEERIFNDDPKKHEDMKKSLEKTLKDIGRDREHGELRAKHAHRMAASTARKRFDEALHALLSEVRSRS